MSSTAPKAYICRYRTGTSKHDWETRSIRIFAHTLAGAAESVSVHAVAGREGFLLLSVELANP